MDERRDVIIERSYIVVQDGIVLLIVCSRKHLLEEGSLFRGAGLGTLGGDKSLTVTETHVEVVNHRLTAHLGTGLVDGHLTREILHRRV